MYISDESRINLALTKLCYQSEEQSTSLKTLSFGVLFLSLSVGTGVASWGLSRLLDYAFAPKDSLKALEEEEIKRQQKVIEEDLLTFDNTLLEFELSDFFVANGNDHQCCPLHGCELKCCKFCPHQSNRQQAHNTYTSKHNEDELITYYEPFSLPSSTNNNSNMNNDTLDKTDINTYFEIALSTPDQYIPHSTHM